MSIFAAIVQQYRGEISAARERVGAALALCQEHGFPFYLVGSMIVQGWTRVEQGEEEERIAQMREALAAGSEFLRPYFLTLPAEAYRKMGNAEEGLLAVEKALICVQRGHGRQHEAELYQLKGELTLKAAQLGSHRSQLESPRPVLSGVEGAKVEEEAETCFQKALLAPVYKRFMEGFDTADLKDAKALLAELS